MPDMPDDAGKGNNGSFGRFIKAVEAYIAVAETEFKRIGEVDPEFAAVNGYVDTFALQVRNFLRYTQERHAAASEKVKGDIETYLSVGAADRVAESATAALKKGIFDKLGDWFKKNFDEIKKIIRAILKLIFKFLPKFIEDLIQLIDQILMLILGIKSPSSGPILARSEIDLLNQWYAVDRLQFLHDRASDTNVDDI